jgi:hypothetical protein
MIMNLTTEPASATSGVYENSGIGVRKQSESAAVRILLDSRPDYQSEWAAFTAISKLFGMSPDTLRTWVRRTQVDGQSKK